MHRECIPEGCGVPSPRWPLLLGLVSLSSSPFLLLSRSSTVRPARQHIPLQRLCMHAR